MTDQPLVVFDGVVKRFGGFVAVDKLDLDIRKGEFLAIMGSSGCGKTTTLRMLAGLEAPTEGEIRLGGKRINDLPTWRRDTPMVWQSRAKNGGFSAAKPWLPVPAEHLAKAVDAQQGDEKSLLEHYRRFLAFRRFHPALVKGDIEFLPTDGDTVAFTRDEGNERLVCVFNLGSETAEVDLGAGLAAQPLSGHGFAGEAEAGRVKLGGYGAWFGRLA